VNPIQEWIKDNSWIVWISLVATLILMIVIVCFKKIARKYPLNIILLFLFTLFESFFVGAISAAYDTKFVLIAFSITCIIVVSLTAFAFQVKFIFHFVKFLIFNFNLILKDKA
jgi:protein lifeguard